MRAATERAGGSDCSGEDAASGRHLNWQANVPIQTLTVTQTVPVAVFVGGLETCSTFPG